MIQTNIRTNRSRSLGIAFLLQACASLISGALFLNPLVDPAHIRTTMLQLANNAGLVHANMIGDLITALGIIYLAAMLFTVVKRQNKALALVALAFYVFEAGILVVSKIAVFVLLNISQEYIATGDQSLETLANLALAAKDFTYRLHIIPFGFGAIIFYYLLYTSKATPAWLPLWGLATVPFVLVGAAWTISGAHMPPAFLVLSLPYVPFEFFAGVYVLVKGLNIQSGKELIS